MSRLTCDICENVLVRTQSRINDVFERDRPYSIKGNIACWKRIVVQAHVFCTYVLHQGNVVFRVLHQAPVLDVVGQR